MNKKLTVMQQIPLHRKIKHWTFLEQKENFANKSDGTCPEHRRHPKLKLFLPSARAYGLFVKGSLRNEISRPILSISSFGSSYNRRRRR